MSPVPNADQFLPRITKAYRRYDAVYRPRADELRAEYERNNQTRVPPDTDESLEAQCRQYLINEVLRALNWSLKLEPGGSPPNLVLEVPVRSVLTDTRRFLDYLGIDGETDRPLLLVEAKRPSSELPRPRDLRRRSRRVAVDQGVAHVIAEGLRGTALTGDWDEWLKDLCDYVRSIADRGGHMPQRVVITNGFWWVIFCDPSDAFLPSGTRDAALIHVFPDRHSVKARCVELFRELDYYALAEALPPVVVDEVTFCIGAAPVHRVMHGLQLLYYEKPGFLPASPPHPAIVVHPVLWLRCGQQSWVCVQAAAQPRPHTVPDDYRKLPEHLQAVASDAARLLDALSVALGTGMTPCPLDMHYHDQDALSRLPGVSTIKERRSDAAVRYSVVTGSNSHYLVAASSHANCRYHDWYRCREEGVEGNPGPIVERSARDPKSYFVCGEAHHCAHGGVSRQKAHQITADNQQVCGPRSGEPGRAFCEIARFEEHLCCRTCAFLEVCVGAEAFHLPCA